MSNRMCAYSLIRIIIKMKKIILRNSSFNCATTTISKVLRVFEIFKEIMKLKISLVSFQKSTGLIVLLVLQFLAEGIASIAAAEEAGAELTLTSSESSLNKENVSETVNKSDLEHAESKDPQKLEIIKQIRKINNDGSYTVSNVGVLTP